MVQRSFLSHDGTTRGVCNATHTQVPLSLGTSKQWVYAGRLVLLPLMHDFPFVSVHEFTSVSTDFQYCYEMCDSIAIFGVQDTPGRRTMLYCITHAGLIKQALVDASQMMLLHSSVYESLGKTQQLTINKEL